MSTSAANNMPSGRPVTERRSSIRLLEDALKTGRIVASNPVILFESGHSLTELGAMLKAHFDRLPGTSVSVIVDSNEFAKYVVQNRDPDYNNSTLGAYEEIHKPQQVIESASPGLEGHLGYLRGTGHIWIPGAHISGELVVTYKP